MPWGRAVHDLVKRSACAGCAGVPVGTGDRQNMTHCCQRASTTAAQVYCYVGASALNVFRSYYPKGRNYLVTPLEGPAYARRFGNLEVTVCEPDGIED